MNVTADGLGFPDGFLWGASTAAHQIEGDNVNSDWWHMDTAAAPSPSPAATRPTATTGWREDMDLLTELGFADYRFSIERARIEPAPGHFSRAEIAHHKAAPCGGAAAEAHVDRHHGGAAG
ncbi:family 1 glycosylhydrolase [Streptomyces azureus]|uniref:Glycoside hydrolase family protein n=1 Tax=Streptomyces azureus TaxID=146537 RepID=A0A0K8PV29_STRAJ|nr:family 1 glycosylhydrolase [Streptomyces azureus]GAP51737.1 glycoside hydrolase family protein [Streptomyces azureus]